MDNQNNNDFMAIFNGEHVDTSNMNQDNNEQQNIYDMNSNMSNNQNIDIQQNQNVNTTPINNFETPSLPDELSTTEDQVNDKPKFNPFGTPMQEDTSNIKSSVTITNSKGNMMTDSSLLKGSENIEKETPSIIVNPWSNQDNIDDTKPKYGTQNKELNIVNEQPSLNEDEELLKIFIGPNYDIITTKHFNFAALFFNCIYFIYRKMYLVGLLLIAIFDLSYIFLKNYSGIVGLAMCILCGMGFNGIYIGHSKDKIEKIKKLGRNDTKEICELKGGTSILSAIIIPILPAVISAIMAFPIVNDEISEAKKMAYKSSTLEFVDSINLYSAVATYGGPGVDNYQKFPQTTSNFTCLYDENSWTTKGVGISSNACADYFASENGVISKVKGKVPNKVEVTLDLEGTVQPKSKFTYGKVECTYNGESDITCK